LPGGLPQELLGQGHDPKQVSGIAVHRALGFGLSPLVELQQSVFGAIWFHRIMLTSTRTIRALPPAVVMTTAIAKLLVELAPNLLPVPPAVVSMWEMMGSLVPFPAVAAGHPRRLLVARREHWRWKGGGGVCTGFFCPPSLRLRAAIISHCPMPGALPIAISHLRSRTDGGEQEGSSKRRIQTLATLVCAQRLFELYRNARTATMAANLPFSFTLIPHAFGVHFRAPFACV
jgi:hypothetical protein